MKIMYKSIGHKCAFKSYCLIICYVNDDIDIMPISKKVFNALEAMGYTVEG